jgi:hypothetical protein
MQITFTANHRAELTQIIEVMESEAKTTPTEELVELTQLITDAYVDQTGKRPSKRLLERMTDVILTADLVNPNPHKMTTEETPIMSERQLKRRIEREWAQNDWNLNTNRPVVGFKSAHFVDDNGVMRKSRQPVYGGEE